MNFDPVREVGRKANHGLNLLDALGCVILGAACVVCGVVLLIGGNAPLKWLPPVLVIGGGVWALYGLDQARQWFGAAPMQRAWRLLDCMSAIVTGAALCACGVGLAYLGFHAASPALALMGGALLGGGILCFRTLRRR